MGLEDGSAPSFGNNHKTALPRYLLPRGPEHRDGAGGDHAWAAAGFCGVPFVLLIVAGVALSMSLKGCSFTRRSCHDTKNPLVDAATDGDTDALDSRLASRQDQSDLDAGLACAAKYGEPEAVVRLLEAGANPNSTSETFGHPLVGAVSEEGVDEPAGFGQGSEQRLRVVKALLFAGADPEPAIRPAAESSSVEIVNALLDAGAPVNGPPGEASPLTSAIFFKNDPVVTLLLLRGADPDVGGTIDRNTLDLALVVLECIRGNDRRPGLSAATGSCADFTYLEGSAPGSGPSTTTRSAGIDVGQGGEVTPLTAAVLVKRTPVIEQLLANHADPNKPSLGRYTPLWAAVRFNDVDTAITLLKAGAQPDPPPGTDIESPRGLALATHYTDMLDLFALFTPAG